MLKRQELIETHHIDDAVEKAVKMVEIAAGCPRPAAVQAMRDAEGNVRVAAVMAKKKVSAEEARALLASRPLRELL